MLNFIDWDNINMYITDNDDRYTRRLKRKKGFINCLHNVPESDVNSLNKLVVYQEKLDDNVSKSKPNVGLKKATKRKLENKHVYVDPDYKYFMDSLIEEEDSLTFKVDSHGCLKIVKYESVSVTKDEGFYKDNRKKWKGDNVENVRRKRKEDLEVLGKEKREKVGAGGYLNSVSAKEKRNIVGKRKGGFRNSNRSMCKTRPVLQRKNNVEKVQGEQKKDLVVLPGKKREKVGVEGQLISVSAKEKRKIVGKGGDGFRNSKRSGVYDLRSVVQRENNPESITAWKPNGLEMVKFDENEGSSYERPFVLEVGRDTENMRRLNRSKREEVEGLLYLTNGETIDNVKNRQHTVVKERRRLVDSSRDSKYPKTNQGNKTAQVVMRGDDFETSNYISANEKKDVMVKEENVETPNVFFVEKSGQMVKGRDSVDNPNLRPWKRSDEKFDRYSDVKVESLCYVDKGSSYEEVGDEHSSDLEILEVNNQRSSSKFVVTKELNVVVNDDNLPIMDDENPEFREKLMDILKRPYDQEEYESLFVKAKDRHLKEDPEDSKLKRRRTVEIYGKSPLDYHPAVKRKLYAARKDNAKRLNILRGFMYWYERTCQEGAFEPWLDKACLAVTPSPRLEE